MTEQQIATVKNMLDAGRLCVGWDDPKLGLRRIVAVEWRGEPAGVLFEDGRWCALLAIDPVEIVAYFRPFAVL